jgi:hypothetical protein
MNQYIDTYQYLPTIDTWYRHKSMWVLKKWLVFVNYIKWSKLKGSILLLILESINLAFWWWPCAFAMLILKQVHEVIRGRRSHESKALPIGNKYIHKISEKLIHTLELKIFRQNGVLIRSILRDHGYLHFESHLHKLTSLWDVVKIRRKHCSKSYFFNYKTTLLLYISSIQWPIK